MSPRRAQRPGYVSKYNLLSLTARRHSCGRRCCGRGLYGLRRRALAAARSGGWRGRVLRLHLTLARGRLATSRRLRTSSRRSLGEVAYFVVGLFRKRNLGEVAYFVVGLQGALDSALALRDGRRLGRRPLSGLFFGRRRASLVHRRCIGRCCRTVGHTLWRAAGRTLALGGGAGGSSPLAAPSQVAAEFVKRESTSRKSAVPSTASTGRAPPPGSPTAGGQSHSHSSSSVTHSLFEYPSRSTCGEVEAPW